MLSIGLGSSLGGLEAMGFGLLALGTEAILMHVQNVVLQCLGKYASTFALQCTAAAAGAKTKAAAAVLGCFVYAMYCWAYFLAAEF